MKLFNNFSLGFKTFGQAFNFIFKHKMGWTFLVPIILTIILFWLGFEFTSYLIDQSKNYLLNTLDLKESTFFMAKYIKMFLSGFLWILFKVAFFIIFTYVNGYLVLAILSPLLAFISEKTEKIVLRNNYPFSFKQLLHDIGRGILIIIRNLFYELMLNLLLLIATLIPLIGQIISIISPFIMFGISSYFYGYSFIDYNSERHKLNVKESVKYVRKNGGLALANGSIFSLFLIIPVLGSLIAGLVAIVSTVSATLAVLEINKINEETNH